MDIEFTMLTAGSCRQLEKLSNNRRPLRVTHFPAHFFLLRHPVYGYILVDTGYSDYFRKETKNWPYAVYGKLLPVDYGVSAAEQVWRLGIENSEVAYVFITHFHADHVAGLREFPNATFICSRTAYETVKDLRGLRALRHAFIPGLLPADFARRVRFIEDCRLLTGINDSRVTDTSKNRLLYDLFEDGSLFAMDLSGHAIGQFGLFFYSDKGAVWLIADAAWDSDAYRYYHLPSVLANPLSHDVNAFKRKLFHIHHYHRKYPDVWIIPSHCRMIKQELTERKG